MRIFPVIENEPLVQENDKTRLDASKSFLAGSSADMTVKIRPSIHDEYVDTGTDKFLDWAYPFAIDLPSNLSLFFDEGAGNLEAELLAGPYTLEELADALEDALNAAGANTYSVTVTDDDEIRIEGSEDFSIDFEASEELATFLGFTSEDTLDGTDVYTGAAIETVQKEVSLQIDVALTLADSKFLDFVIGATPYAAEIPAGTYATLADLLATLEDALNAPDHDETFTVSEAAGVITIACTTVFDILGVTGANAEDTILPTLGFEVDDLVDAESYTGDEAVAMLTRKTLTLDIISEFADGLFSTDQKLRTHESDILQYVADGRASFKDIHRQAQTDIFEYINKNGWTDDRGEKITKLHLIDKTEVAEWATYAALKMIFENNIKQSDDIFAKKAKKYEALEVNARARLVLRLDLNRDGVQDKQEQVETFRGGVVIRR